MLRIPHVMALGSVLALAWPVHLHAQAIQVLCGRPFGDKAVGRAIDALCPNEGKRVKSWSDQVWEANRIENQVKNEFCAPGPARTLTLADFTDLQQRAEQLRTAGTIT